MRNLIVLAFALCTAACNTAWPVEGSGGMAEFKSPEMPAQVTTVTKPRLVQIEHHMDCSQQRFAVLSRTTGGTGQHTGRLAQLGQELNRAKRELAGLLPEDADRTLHQFDQEVAVLGLVVHAAPPDSGQCTA